MSALWTVKDMVAAMGARRRGKLPEAITGISIDSRTLGNSDAFFAIKGDARDGHEFVDAALENGAGLAVVSAKQAGRYPRTAPLLIVPNVLTALRKLAKAARKRSTAKIIAVTGSVGKTSTKEALRLALTPDGETHASASSYNNHWGVPLSLARMPASAKYGVFEIGMNHAGEIMPLTKMVRPHIAIVTAIAPVHLEFFGTLGKIADAKAEVFQGLVKGGVAVLNRDDGQFARLNRAAKVAGVKRVVTFGEHAKADVQLLKYSLQPESSTVQARVFGTDAAYKLGTPGRHLLLNSLAVLAAAALAGADLALAVLALAKLQPAPGRGTRKTLAMPGGKALLIDDSYNANPASMRAAIALLGQAPVGARGRRIAILGDMLELGPKSRLLHRELSGPLEDAKIDLVFCSGPAMASLWEALPSTLRGGYAGTSAELEAAVLRTVRAGDVVMVKGSLGSRMGLIVKALEQQFPRLADAATG